MNPLKISAPRNRNEKKRMPETEIIMKNTAKILEITLPISFIAGAEFLPALLTFLPTLFIPLSTFLWICDKSGFCPRIAYFCSTVLASGIIIHKII